jgi:ribulose kinase
MRAETDVTHSVGGTMSLEMELPKMLWLKRHMPKDVFARSSFFDLPDYLTYLATGDSARSNCSLACKVRGPTLHFPAAA